MLRRTCLISSSLFTFGAPTKGNDILFPLFCVLGYMPEKENNNLILVNPTGWKFKYIFSTSINVLNRIE